VPFCEAKSGPRRLTNTQLIHDSFYSDDNLKLRYGADMSNQVNPSTPPADFRVGRFSIGSPIERYLALQSAGLQSEIGDSEKPPHIDWVMIQKVSSR
jgi:hypothetical protein